MPNKIGIVIAADGEKDFTNSMKSAMESVKKFDAELKNLDEECKGNANSLESLTKKQEKLKEKQEAANRQLEAAKSGLSNAKKNYRDAGEALDKYKDELEDARKELQKMDDAGEKGTAAYKKQARAVEDLEKKVSKQAAEQQKASTNITRWETNVTKADGAVKKINTDVDKNSKYLKEAQTSSDKCAKSIDKMGNEMKDTAKDAEQMGGGLKDAISVMAGNLMSQGVSMLADGLKDAAQYVIEVGSNFETSMSKVEALSGASAEQLQRMSDKARELGASTQYSASEVADAFSYMSLAGWSTEDMLASIDGVLNLAAASQMDLAQASDMVTDYLSAFGLSAENAGHMADMLAYAQANSNTTTTQLGDAFGNCAANMNAAGQDMETTTAILEGFANQGLKGSEAGTKLAAIMRDITAKMKDGKIQIGDTAVAVQDADGNFRDLTDILADVESATNGMGDAQKASALAATFTSRSVSGLNMILNEGVGNIANYEEALRNSDGAAANMANTMNNNFQGAVKDLDSKVESLGIAVWEKINGPITGAVETLGGIISGITDLIAPEQTALEKFISDIEEANETVQQSIDNARSTVESGEQRFAEITAYGEEIKGILEKCEQFNQVTLEDGKTAIINASGEIVTEEILDTFASGGLNTEKIIESANNAKDAIGYISEEVDSVEKTLDDFGRNEIDTSEIEKGKVAVVQIFNDMGEIVGTVKTDIENTGKVSIPTETIGEGTTAIITCFDDTTESVGRFKAGVEELSGTGVDLSTITSEFERVQDSITTTYHITDEFTKIKIDTMVSALGDSVEGLAEAWDSTTGTLRASKEELESWFDTAKQVAMYDALRSAVNELYDAWGKSAVNMAKASSATEAALQAFNEEAGTTFTTAQEALDWLSDGERGWYDTAEALNAAADAETATAESMREADAELQNTVPQLEKYITGLGDQSEAAEEASESNNNLTESYEALTEEQQKAIDGFKELTGKTTSEMAELQAQLQMSNEEFANWCTQRTEETQQVIDAYQKLVESVAQSMHEFATSIDTSGEEGSSAIDNMVRKLTEKTTELQTWVANMKILGQKAGKELPQGLYDELLQGGPAKTAEAVQALVDAAQNETEKFEEVAAQYNEALTIEAEAESLAQYSSTGKAYAEAVQEGFVGSQAEYEAAVAESMESGAQTAQVTAEGYTEAGQQAGQNLAEGEKSTEGEVTGAAQGVIEAGIQSATTASDMFKEVGRIAMLAVSAGMNSKSSNVDDRAEKLLTDAKSKADNVAAKFNETGNKAGSQFATGLNTQRGSAVSAGSSVASGAKAAAASWTNSFYSVGVQMSQGISQGIMSQARAIASAAANVVRQALNAARAEAQIQSPSKKFKRLVGAQISAGVAWGIRQNTGLAVEAAEALIGQTLAAMDTRLGNARASMSEITYAWQRTAGQMIQNGFGISRTQTSNGQTTQRSDEDYYRDVYRAAETFMENLRVLYDVSEEEELAYWQRVQASLRRGTQAWYDATARINELTDSVTEHAAEAAQRQQEIEQERLQAIVESADNYLESIGVMHSTSIKQEIAYWEAIRRTLTAGTEAYQQATNRINQLQQRIGTISNADSILSTYQLYHEMSEGEEVEYWDIIRQQYAAGTQERIEADQRYLDAKKRQMDKLKALEEDYQDKVEDVNRRLADRIDELNKKYTDAVKTRQDAIMNSFNLTDYFESTSVDGQTLLFNMQSQAEGYEYWEQQLAELSARGILSDELLQELADMGPSAVATVVALNSLSDSDLQAYMTAYNKKADVSHRQAEHENEGLRQEVDEEILTAQQQAAHELHDLRTDFDTNTGKITGSISGGLRTLASDIRNISEDEARLFAAAIQGGGTLTDSGFASSTGSHVSSSAIASASGTNAIAHNGNAVHDAAAEILSVGSKRSKTLKASEQNFSDLFRYIVTKYGVQPGQAMYKALAQVLGVTVSDKVTGSQMNDILAALKKAGLRHGTKYLEDAFAWMDEAGLGSEMIVRKSDGAILNTAVQRGDAIIPADLTENLYRWGAYNPDLLIPEVMSAARMNAMAEAGYRSVSETGGRGESSMLEQMLGLMTEFLPYMAEKTHIVMDGDKLVDYASQNLAMRSRRYRG